MTPEAIGIAIAIAKTSADNASHFLMASDAVRGDAIMIRSIRACRKFWLTCGFEERDPNVLCAALTKFRYASTKQRENE